MGIHLSDALTPKVHIGYSQQPLDSRGISTDAYTG
jgi:hypothetical protein